MPDQKAMRTSCLGGSSLMWVPKLLFTPIKLGILAKTEKLAQKRPNLAQTCIFCQILAFLANLIQCPTKKQCKQGVKVVSPLRRYQNFCFLPSKLGFWVQIWPKRCIVGHFGPNIGIFGSFDTMNDQKTMQTKCLGGFSVTWVKNFCFLP